MIIAKNIHKAYGDIKVLNGIDLTIKQGEIISIVGKSGAGKSTLLHILGTLDSMDEGSILYDGTDLNKLNEKQLAKFRNQKIGFVFQFHHLLQEFTALENVMIPAMIAKADKKESKKHAIELLHFFGLQDRMDHKPNQLSGGEAQRVAVARALINKPSIVFADEPTGNLDKHNSTILHEMLLKTRVAYNNSFVIVTHNSDLSNLSDRVIQMSDGNIVSD